MRITSVTHHLVYLILFGLLAACAQSDPQTENHPKSSDLIERFSTTKSFDDVIQELEFAITERNFRITGRNTVGKGLRKRGYEDFPDIEVIHFCSLDIAKEVLDIDPGFVAQMPCRVTIHEDKDDRVIVSLIKLPEDHDDPRVNEFSTNMNKTLREIVDFALEDNAVPFDDN